MPVKSNLRKLSLCLVLEFAALMGIPLRVEEINRAMGAAHRIEYSKSNDSAGSDEQPTEDLRE